MIDFSHPFTKWAGASASGGATYVGTKITAAAVTVHPLLEHIQFYCGVFVTIGGAVSTVLFIGCLVLDFRRKLRNDRASGRLDAQESDTTPPSRIA
jgi:hypothetical protein